MPQMSIKVKKAELIERLEKEREAHIEQHKKAVVAWREKLVRIAERIVEHGDKVVRFPKSLSRLEDTPELHVDWFDNVLTMLKMSVEDELVLSPRDFNEIVLGERPWTRSWAVMNFMYTGATGPTGPTGSTGSTGSAWYSPAGYNSDIAEAIAEVQPMDVETDVFFAEED